MKILIGFFLVLQVFIFNRASSQTEIRMDPAGAFGGTASQIFETIRYIPLETTRNSVFGAIDQLGVTKKYFIVLDLSTNSIIIFNREGKFYSRIDGGDVSSYKTRLANQLEEFAINRDSNIIVFKKGAEKIISYNIDLQKATNYQIKVPGRKMKLDGVPYFFNSDTRVFVDYDVVSPRSDSVDYELKFVRKGRIYHQEFPYNWRSSNLPDEDLVHLSRLPFYESSVPDQFLYVRLYDYKIYQVLPDTCKPLFKFIFPQTSSLPSDFLTNAVYASKRVKFCRDNSNMIYSLSHTYLLKDNLFFRVNRFGINPGSQSYLYNIKSGKLIDVKRVVSDQKNAFLPIAVDRSQSAEFMNSDFLASDMEYVYTAYSSLFMFTVKTNTANKLPKYDDAMKRYFGNEDRKSNPVIVQLKPKTIL